MSMYMYLVVVTLLVLPTDSFICMLPKQSEHSMKVYQKNEYFTVSTSVVRNMMAYTSYYYDENNKTIISGRFVKDYNVMIQFHIHPNGSCTLQKLTEDLVKEIPDNAVRLDQFPVPWPYKVPDKTEYWSFNSMGYPKIISAVGRIQPKVCIPRATALYTSDKQISPYMVAFGVGNYSLIIKDKKVFQVPPACLHFKG